MPTRVGRDELEYAAGAMIDLRLTEVLSVSRARIAPWGGEKVVAGLNEAERRNEGQREPYERGSHESGA